MDHRHALVWNNFGNRILISFFQPLMLSLNNNGPILCLLLACTKVDNCKTPSLLLFPIGELLTLEYIFPSLDSCFNNTGI